MREQKGLGSQRTGDFHFLTQTFVPYSPGVERADPDFEQSLQTVIEGDEAQYARIGQAEGSAARCATRTPRATGSPGAKSRSSAGCRRNTPRASTPSRGAMRRWPLLERPPIPGRTRCLPPVCGIGLKIFGIAGKTLLEDEPDSGTFDYAKINTPIFFANTVEHT